MENNWNVFGHARIPNGMSAPVGGDSGSIWVWGLGSGIWDLGLGEMQSKVEQRLKA